MAVTLLKLLHHHKRDLNVAISEYNAQRRFFQRSFSMRRVLLVLLSCFLAAASLFAEQKLSAHWEELTADDFHRAIEASIGTCVLPSGILEKHDQPLRLS